MLGNTANTEGGENDKEQTVNPKLQVTMVRVFGYVEKKKQLQKLDSQNSKREQEIQKLQCSARIFRKQKVFMCGIFFSCNLKLFKTITF